MTHDPDRETTPPEVLAGGSERTPLGERWRGLSRRTRAVTTAVAVAVLALGGTYAFDAVSGGGKGGTTPAASGSASGSDASDRGGDWYRSLWFGLAVHGESTVKDPDSGDWVVRVWQWGTAEEVDGDRVTVRSEDGAQWTWSLDSDTTVHREGSGGLTNGDELYLAGTRSAEGRHSADHVLAGAWDKRAGQDGGGPA
ncbi:hypothetical protein [Streptomyces sp. NPDC003635]